MKETFYTLLIELLHFTLLYLLKGQVPRLHQKIQRSSICLKTQRLRIFRNIGMNSSLLIAQLPKIMISVDVSSQMTPPLSQALTTDGLFFVQLNMLISTTNWKKLNYLENVLHQLKIKVLIQLILLSRKSAPTHLLQKGGQFATYKNGSQIGSKGGEKVKITMKGGNIKFTQKALL